MSNPYSTLLLDIDDSGVATLTINRPDKMNALNNDVLNDLADFSQKAVADDKIKGIIITGAGEKAFVAGADIGELSELNERSGRMVSQKGQQIFQSIEDIRKPVIALVNGYALGGGAELAMSCHMRIATENAVFGLPEVGLGLIPGYGGTQRLPRMVGKAKALEMILTGDPIKAEEALEIGLVNKVVAKEDAMNEAKSVMNKIAANGPIAIKEAIKAVYHSDTKSGYQIESTLFGSLCNTEDFKEGTEAFLDKREPDFKGN